MVIVLFMYCFMYTECSMTTFLYYILFANINTQKQLTTEPTLEPDLYYREILLQTLLIYWSIICYLFGCCFPSAAVNIV